jgi:hypothetical protein
MNQQQLNLLNSLSTQVDELTARLAEAEKQIAELKEQQ